MLSKDRTILVVDDDDGVRGMLVALLARSHQVLAARDGLDALAALSVCGVRVDLVVTDIHMPRLDGVGLAHRLRAEMPW
jgi:CheY-like chemotaxis protein